MAQGTLPNAWRHLCTINKHKLLVTKYCFRVGLYRQGLTHDLSKYSPTEFKIGIKYYRKGISPHDAARSEMGYSEGWLHHKGRNKHHHEYWLDVKEHGDNRLEGKPMPTRYVVEMFCERVAANKIYQL